jgi:hypothetical protein
MDGRIIFGGDDIDVELGTHSAHPVAIVTKSSDAYGDFRAWEFKLASGAAISGSTSMSMHPQSKGGRWAVAILGRTPARGEDITEALIGRPCLVSVVEGKNGWTTVGDVMANMATARSGPAPVYEPVATAVGGDLPF